MLKHGSVESILSETNVSYYSSTLHFVCPLCGEDNAVDIPLPKSDLNGEGVADSQAEFDTLIECASEDCSVQLDAVVVSQVGAVSVTFPSHPNVVVSAEAPIYNSLLVIDHEIPEHPDKILLETINELRALNLAKGEDEPTSLINRMIFTQTIGALEAYLSDTLINEVIRNEEALGRALENDSRVSDLKFSLLDIYRTDDIVLREVCRNLQERLYHRIDDVVRWYVAILGFSPVPDRSDLLFLRQAVAYRHDCVHRNGYEKSGARLRVFSQKYLGRSLSIVDSILDHVESEIRLRSLFGESPDDLDEAPF